MNVENGYWLLPTAKRLPKLRKVFSAIREVGCSTKGLVLVNLDEYKASKAEYDALDLPAGWRVEGIDGDCQHDCIRGAWRLYKDCDWVGVLSDDLIPGAMNWDSAVVRRLNGWNFVTGDDGWQVRQTIHDSRCHGATAWSGDLIRAVGYLTPKGFKHMFVDDVWENLGRTTNCWELEKASKCIHQHASRPGSINKPDEVMERNNAFMAPDHARFQQWLQYEREGDIKKIRDLMAAKGLKSLDVDLKAVKLMIGTPCIDDKWPGIYIMSLLGTMQLMQGNGVQVQWTREVHNADIVLARSKILATFMQSEATHLLFIDSDMGWQPASVLRLFAAKKDFVAVAGPKKFYVGDPRRGEIPQLKFAASWTDDEGNPRPLVFEQDSGAFEMSHVGMAFALVSRACVEKMIVGYPELVAESVTAQNIPFVFLPYIETLVSGKRIYRSEDFAYCSRWHQIGGQIYVCADVPLGHLGDHVFEGDMMSAWRYEEAARALAQSGVKVAPSQSEQQAAAE